MLPCMAGILPSSYLTHASLFVAAVYYLNKERITAADITTSLTLVNDFHSKFLDLYGKKIVSFPAFFVSF